jgi:hypothetical protein
LGRPPGVSDRGPPASRGPAFGIHHSPPRSGSGAGARPSSHLDATSSSIRDDPRRRPAGAFLQIPLGGADERRAGATRTLANLPGRTR